ncbi:amidohydrolase family protein [Glaciecola petra]|uniref:Amidohydrolase family protein n=1 Tax=Glaciecola petra TaxID=3075602 RepID=A0ABU2ZNE9_9ALTE|nr:amidohydrolase family protein [Aestuariibacter sp. P117]MDT0594153.1 amidohydrolase family protein [Aestuariibacter sp. P117]
MTNHIFKVIDPHVHFFDLEKGRYAWLQPNNEPNWENKDLIAKNFGPQDLVLNNQMFLSGYVHIEAGFNNEQADTELAWLNTFEHRHKAIACCDLTQTHEDFKSNVIACEQFQSLQGFRHILDEDVNVILGHMNTQTNIAEINSGHYVFECQINANLEVSFDLLHHYIRQTPNIKWVINHAGKPDLSADDNGTFWQNNMRKFAEHKNVYVKFSGFEMSCTSYHYRDLVKCMAILTSIFPQERIMCASNFPVILLKHSYVEYWQTIIRVCNELNVDTDMLIYANAKKIYGFSDN